MFTQSSFRICNYDTSWIYYNLVVFATKTNSEGNYWLIQSLLCKLLLNLNALELHEFG